MSITLDKYTTQLKLKKRLERKTKVAKTINEIDLYELLNQKFDNKNTITIKSTQYCVLLALRKGYETANEIHYYLTQKLKRDLSIESVKHTLKYMERKGLVERTKEGKYKLKLNFRESVKSIDFARVRARYTKSPKKPTKKRDQRGKYAVSPKELMIKYNPTNIARHIRAHIKQGEYINAICELIYLGGGLRPSDIIKEVIIMPSGEIVVIVYEKKTRRIRIVERFSCPLFIKLIKLLKEMEVYQQLLRVLKEQGREIIKEINEHPDAYLDLCDIKLCRRIYLSYYGVEQATYLPEEELEWYREKAKIIIRPEEDEWSSSEESEKIANKDEDTAIIPSPSKGARGIIIGTHANPNNAEYYIQPKAEF